MGISIGSQLGFHEITALLGKGGMGEVYRARDLRLKREVAIKILPEEFSRDADRVGRFQREAEVLASLNHPNIASIHSFEEAGGTRYLVLELVEGETLEERIRRGPIPIEEALTIAKNICEALEAAHDKGVVHRDLKPANVKVTPDGKVKVLDFGLAKAMDNGPANAALSNSPTLINSVAATNAGVIIGTAAYMSPEQARGYAADQRSDVFSFGCVLYEMLGGKSAFGGETISDILASVLVRDVDFAVLPKDLNPKLLDFLRRCLQKNRKNRWHCVADLNAELESIAASPRVLLAVEAAASKSRPLWKRAIPVVVTAILVTIVTVLVESSLKPTISPAVTRFPLRIPRALSANLNPLAISPDGSQLVYVADKKLYLQSMSEFDSKPIAGTDAQGLSLIDAVFSPDGHSVVYVDSSSVLDATIKKIAIAGGAPVTLFHGGVPLGISWDGNAIVFEEYAGAVRRIVRLPAGGGMPEELVILKSDEFVVNPQLLPGGQAVLFTVSDDVNKWDKARVVVQRLKTGDRKTIIEGGNAARYIPTGHIVYALGGTLMAAPFDVSKLEVVGGSGPVVEGVLRAGAGMAAFDVSSNGSLAYIPGPTSGNPYQRTLELIALNGDVKPLGLPAGTYVHPRASRDGKRIAFGTDDAKEPSISIYDLAGTASMRRLTFGGANRYPVWSPDSQRVAFQSDRDGDSGIFSQRADGTGTVERLTKAEKDTQHIPDSWSPDGQWLSFTLVKAGTTSVWLFSSKDKNITAFPGIPGALAGRSVFSPDGKWIAYQSSETGQTEIFVQPFPPTGTKYQITRGTDSHHPLWSSDGKELFYIPGPGQFLKVALSTQTNFSVGNPTPALPGGAFLAEGGPTFPRSYDILPDGKLLGTSTGMQSSTQAPPEIRVVLNWFTELQQRVPAK
jgi:serine/threonine-protein kinase